MAYGYPEGGDSLSITKGIVSRIEFTPYQFSGRPACASRLTPPSIPATAAARRWSGDKMIGLAFSHLGERRKHRLHHPLRGDRTCSSRTSHGGEYDGKPAMFDDLQTLENPALRSFLKLDKSVHGIVVHSPYED